ncbi:MULTISPECIES: metal ABC transporter solute-binding protein, Zn/Mn family [Sanguibacteroides]|uniref:ABC transporter substrate-binding protein n=1 Tax=Sanguibacteroides justesenii TaxID=1547597 RepID=A0AB34R2P9_9PORP|nr:MULTISPECIES: zinc ABC transporter substrate-binding protein [Sanguibacteroides]KIO43215.1 ABC transporter substrate-binding protein [Sanguibacteroides justesenii]PXZ43151.1 ABC transporter substrate-binding protein [Sanguibacteroides justesenii]
MKWIWGIVLLLCIVACGTKQDKSKNISVSILPQKYFVERIAGDFVRVNVMIPPGANPAISDLTSEQLKMLNNSSLYFAVGYLPFELTHIYSLLKNRRDIQLIKHTDAIELPEKEFPAHKHGDVESLDPHIWMSPTYAKQMARTIRDVLSDNFPEKKNLFSENCDRFMQEIDSVDREARRIILSKRHKLFLIYHPALTYFARDYGMEQIAIEDEGKEPNPVHVRAIIDRSREKGVRVVFIQSQFDEANARAIATEIGGEVIAIDPLSPDWKEEMISLLKIIDQKMD